MGAIALMGAASSLPAQTSLNSLSAVVSVDAPEKIVAKPGAVVETPFTVQVKDGFHVNSNTPADEYLIPLKFTFTPGRLEVVDVVFPKPLLKRFEFSNKPVSVFEGSFKVLVRAKASAQGSSAAAPWTGKLRYQACNDRMCLPPRTLEIKVPVEILR